MRTDSNLDPAITRSKQWKFGRGLGGAVVNVRQNAPGSETKWTAYSHSGNERNQAFLNLGNGSFTDVSGISGADSIADGRSFVFWDPDRDGRLDMALANANEPALQLFANRSATVVPGADNGFIALRVTGANRSSRPAPGQSTRDAIGTVITIDTGETTLLRVLSAGEGFASQNSRICVVGIGAAREAQSVQVTFPSGREILAPMVPAGTLLEVDEATGAATRQNYQPDPDHPES